MRCGEIKRRESKLASSHFLIFHSLDCSEVFMELYREEEREEVDRGGQTMERTKGSDYWLACSLLF